MEPSAGKMHVHRGRQHLAAPLLALNLGITGHRPNRLPEDTAPIRARLEHVLWRIRTALAHLPQRDAFSAATPHLRLTSALAAGADVLAAQAAIEAGYELGVCLPFAEEEYRKDFPEAADQEVFGHLLAKAASVITLAGDRSAQNAAYEAVGLSMLSFSDMVIAVWDGERAAGPGGTAEIAARAVDENVPVIHVPVDPDSRIEIIWAGLSDLPSTRPTLWTAPRIDFESEIDGLVQSLVAPPVEPALPQIAEALEGAPRRLLPMHRTWPLLLSLFGANRIELAEAPDAALPAPPPADTGPFSRQMAKHLAPLAEASDQSANIFGLKHRSGFVNNFVLAALAVTFAAAVIVVKKLSEGAAIYLTLAEITTIGLILFNTWRGNKGAWHAKWLQMRHLAEWSRVLTFALPLGYPLLRFSDEAQADWIRWRARAAARAVGYPSIPVDAAAIGGMRAILLDAIAGQLAYHRRNAARMHRMDHRTHLGGLIVFTAGIAIAIVHLLHEWHWLMALVEHYLHFDETWESAFTMLSVTLPAFGSAIYGIRLQGDFVGLADRSEGIANRLARLHMTIEADPMVHAVAADRVRQLALIMLQDTADWRRTFEGRPFVLPS